MGHLRCELWVLIKIVCLSVLTWHLLLNYWMNLLQIFRNSSWIPRFACSSVVRLSKYLTGHVLLNYWMDLLQIFRNYFLRSLYLQVLPLFVCLSKYLSGLLLQNYWVDWPMLASKYSVISSKYFVLVITYHFSLSFIEIIRALSQGGGGIPPSLPWRPGLKDDLYDWP